MFPQEGILNKLTPEVTPSLKTGCCPYSFCAAHSLSLYMLQKAFLNKTGTVRALSLSAMKGLSSKAHKLSSATLRAPYNLYINQTLRHLHVSYHIREAVSLPAQQLARQGLWYRCLFTAFLFLVPSRRLLSLSTWSLLHRPFYANKLHLIQFFLVHDWLLRRVPTYTRTSVKLCPSAITPAFGCFPFKGFLLLIQVFQNL